LGDEFTAEVLPFAAFFGFMGVNLAVIQQFYLMGGDKRRVLADAIVPGLGALFCFGICWGFATPAKIAGGLWLLAAVVYDAIRTRGFRLRPVMLEVDEP
jgi:putrescine importer